MTEKLKQAPWYRIAMVAAIGAVLLALELARSQDFSADELALLVTFLLGAAGIEWGRSKIENKP